MIVGHMICDRWFNRTPEMIKRWIVTSNSHHQILQFRLQQLYSRFCPLATHIIFPFDLYSIWMLALPRGANSLIWQHGEEKKNGQFQFIVSFYRCGATQHHTFSPPRLSSFHLFALSMSLNSSVYRALQSDFAMAKKKTEQIRKIMLSSERANNLSCPSVVAHSTGLYIMYACIHRPNGRWQRRWPRQTHSLCWSAMNSF